MCNVFIIYPERIAFMCFYYVNRVSFDKKFLFKFIESLSVTLIIGLPIIFIKIIYLCFTEKSLHNVWYNLSKYKNIKIIFKNGEIIRNMRPYNLEHLINHSKSIEYGVMITGRTIYGVAFDKNTCVGVTYSTNGMKGRGCDIVDVYLDGTKSLMQYYDGVILNKTVSNDKISSILNICVATSIIKAEMKFIKSSEIISNSRYKQELIIINQYMKSKVEYSLEKLGGIENINNYIINIDNVINMIFKFRLNLNNNVDNIDLGKVYGELKSVVDSNIFPSLNSEINDLLYLYDLMYK